MPILQFALQRKHEITDFKTYNNLQILGNQKGDLGNYTTAQIFFFKILAQALKGHWVALYARHILISVVFITLSTLFLPSVPAHSLSMSTICLWPAVHRCRPALLRSLCLSGSFPVERLLVQAGRCVHARPPRRARTQSCLPPLLWICQSLLGSRVGSVGLLVCL